MVSLSSPCVLTRRRGSGRSVVVFTNTRETVSGRGVPFGRPRTYFPLALL